MSFRPSARNTPSSVESLGSPVSLSALYGPSREMPASCAITLMPRAGDDDEGVVDVSRVAGLEGISDQLGLRLGIVEIFGRVERHCLDRYHSNTSVIVRLRVMLHPASLAHAPSLRRLCGKLFCAPHEFDRKGA